MRALVLASGVMLFATMSAANTETTGAAATLRAGAQPLLLAQTGEREGQDPDVLGDDGKPGLPGSGDPGKRVGQDPDVPITGTPKIVAPSERVGQDPDVPLGDEPVR